MILGSSEGVNFSEGGQINRPKTPFSREVISYDILFI
jgi:hypothetical protein